MDTINGIFLLTAMLVGSMVMGGCIVCVVDWIRLFLTAHGTVEQIEARNDALAGMAILAGAFALAALTQFIGVETITRITWLIFLALALMGMGLGLIRMGYSARLLVTARGDVQQISKGKDILWHSVIGTAILVVMFVMMR